MISTVLESQSANAYIDELRERLSHQDQDVFNWLVIAHDDRNMIRRVSNALEDAPAAILRISQSTWDFGERSLVELIEWAVREARVKTIVLLGHSLGGVPADLVSYPPTQHANRLLGNVIQAQQRLADAKDHLAENITDLREIPIVAEALSRKTLETHGLFYIAESGAFVRYDVQAKTFVPMAGMSHGERVRMYE